MSIHFKPILPKALNARAFANALFSEARNANRIVRRQLDRTVATWRHKPGFRQTVDQNADETVGFVYTESDIYKFVSRGTKVRYATMTRNFIPKTQVRRIFSGPGRGGLHYVDRRRPRPGIRARQFEQTIAEDRAVQLAIRALARRAMRIGAQNSGHAYP